MALDIVFCRRLELSAAIVIVSSALGYDIGCCRRLESSLVSSALGWLLASDYLLLISSDVVCWSRRLVSFFAWLAVGCRLELSASIVG